MNWKACVGKAVMVYYEVLYWIMMGPTTRVGPSGRTALFCSLSPAEIVGSNSTADMDVCLL